MKLAWILFGLLLAMCALVGYILVLPEPPGAAGVPHPQFHTMQQGGDGALSLLVSLTLFFAVSLLREPPRIDPDIEAVMDL